MARRMDVAPAAPATLPVTGLGSGWEPTTILALTLLLGSFGLITLYSASSVLAQRLGQPDYFYVSRQTSGMVVGFLGMILLSRVPTVWWRRLAWPLLIGTWILLILLILPWTHAIAPEIKGARRWLNVGVTIQPSELAKLAVIIWTAALAIKKQPLFQSLRRGLGPFLVVWAVVLLPIAAEPDLSTACLIGLLGALVVFAAGARITHFLFLGLLTLPVLVAQLGVGFRARRIAAFLDPGSDPAGAGFQVYQSLVAIGSGGLTGVGFGEGRQKFGFLPEAHNDFIFAMVGEEWGLGGVCFLLVLYLGLILVGFRVARRARDQFGQLLAIGMTNLIALQAFLHIGVGLSLLPPTGLSLPLVSFGRSNVLVSFAALGILIAVARETPDGRTGRA